MSEKLLRWFGTRRKIEAIRMLNAHARMTINGVEELIRGFHRAEEGKEKEIEESFNRQLLLEKEADVYRRGIIDELAKGEITPDERVGLMRLARQIDWIADWTLESERILEVFKLRNAPENIQDACLEMLLKVKECTVKVVECIQRLSENKIAETLISADGVERIEEDVDDLYQKVRKLLFLSEYSSANVTSAILLAQFLDAIENIADKCEDTCDQVRVIVVAMKEKTS